MAKSSATCKHIGIGSVHDVKLFALGTDSPITGDVTSELYLMAISIASVFFGAMAYLGNATNFMIKNIAAQTQAKVPNFIEYVYNYSIPVLVPLFALIWFLFFNH